MLKVDFLKQLESKGILMDNYDFTPVPEENGIDLIHIFEFENLDKWKRKLANYIANPSQYTVQFSNEKRTVNSFVLKGKTLIKLT